MDDMAVWSLTNIFLLIADGSALLAFLIFTWGADRDR
jgi:hypothetical protein